MDTAKKQLYDGRKIIIDAFKNKLLPYSSRGKEFEYEDEEEGSPINKLGNLIDEKRREINE